MIIYIISIIYFSILEMNLYFDKQLIVKNKISEYRQELKEHISELNNIKEFKEYKTELDAYIKMINNNVDESKTIQELDTISLSYLLSFGSYVEYYKEKQLTKKDK